MGEGRVLIRLKGVVRLLRIILGVKNRREIER
jgi:hypothetical protein